ncbi:SH3 domain-containing C40 family peptidase [Paenibacillus pinistramenti]|uniref:C40 family peptidase n=1 Tax=Paenibacillus pinistramenti TaxID=1768003 RepID=UPI0011095CB4|nr:SH3 domain-containing C40 family peptidase [Paenibacillus pinistramenti]
MRVTKWTAAALLGAAVLAGLPALPASPIHAAEVQSQVYTGVVVKGVNLRSQPSTSGSIITMLKTGETLTNVTASGSYWYKVTTSSGVTGYVSSSSAYIQVTPVTSTSSQSSSAATGLIVSGVNLRSEPSTSSSVIRLVKKGETVQVLEAPNSYWYKIKTSDGQTGYISSSSKYVEVQGQVPSSSGSVSGSTGGTSSSNSSVGSTASRDQLIQKVFEVGRSYLGTPYQYGSDRSTTATFDCSDFTRTAYREATGVILPADSRQQGDWVKANSTAVYDINSLKPGDLMFFMDYLGSTDAAYAGVDKTQARISHVAIYMGNGQILHTYSVSSGGVRIDTLSTSWKRRFLFGGSVL